jgi:hypothetical protein
MIDTTMCWNCDAVYLVIGKKCPECGATNANVDLETSQQERVDKTLIKKDAP